MDPACSRGKPELSGHIDDKKNRQSIQGVPDMERTIASRQTGSRDVESRGITGRAIFHAVLSFLANVLQKIRAGFWSARNRLSGEITEPHDIDHIAERLRVVRRAQEDGRRNLPPPSEEAPAGAQREIIAYFTNLHRRARQQAAEAVEKANRTLEQIRDSDDLAKLRDIPAGYESKLLRYLADFESRLQYAVERERNQKRHYETFRKENKLDRVANYPEVAYLYYLVVPFLIAAMAYALASLLVPSAGGSGGLSLIWSVSVSAGAVIVPFMLGMVSLRAINHVSDFKNLAGWVGVIATVAAILAIAYYADFHIEAVLADPDTSKRDVFEAILAAPLDVISGVASWAIFGVFALVGLLAMFLGYRSDDTYPEYGAVQRSYYRARNELDNLSLRLRKRINALVDEAEAEVRSITRGYKAKVRTYTRMVRKFEQFPSVLNDYDVALEDGCNIVLDRYRAANMAARDSEAPMSFTEHVCFNTEGQIPSGRQSDSSNDLDKLQNSVIELENEAKLALQNLRALNLRMINTLAEPQFVDTESSA